MSLYTKHRPRKFDEVIGNIAAVTALHTKITGNILPSSLLLFGESGCGKTTVARIIALTLNCDELDKGNPCLKCESCTSILSGSNFDYIERNVADFRGIDSVRDIISKMNYAPSFLRNRVIILDEAHALTTDAQNCLLKPLEEPPSHNFIILCTTNPSKLLKTVRNRCDKHEFKLFSKADCRTLVKSTLKKEEVSLSTEVLEEFVSSCSRSPRDLLNQLDSLLAQENPDTIESVIATLDLVDDSENSKAIEFARGLLYKQDSLRDLCKALDKGTNTEGYRRVIVAYTLKCLVGAKDKTAEAKARKILDEFIIPIEQTALEADFIRRVYKFVR